MIKIHEINPGSVIEDAVAFYRANPSLARELLSDLSDENEYPEEYAAARKALEQDS